MDKKIRRDENGWYRQTEKNGTVVEYGYEDLDGIKLYVVTGTIGQFSTHAVCAPRI